MKTDSLWMTEIGKIEVQEVFLEDEPDYDEIQVNVKACGICMGDINAFKGISKHKIFPSRFGHEAVGIVSKVGRKVSKFKVHDKVFITGDGTLMAQWVNISANNCAKIPDDVTDFAKWIGEPVVCVVSSLANCPIELGDRVVLIGTGYMGILHVQGYAASLVGSLICFDIDDDRLALAKEYGATEVYNINSEDAHHAIEKIKSEGGIDLVVECSASQAGLQLAYSLMRTGGKLNLFAWHHHECTFNATQQHMGGWKIYNTSPFIDAHIEDRITQTARLMTRGVFDQSKLITHVKNYKEAQLILEIAAARKDGYIKGAIIF